MTSANQTQGTFLAWHRLFLSEYEQAIRECGFEGAQPYWDWSLDAEDLGASEVFDPESGFGGNGEWVPGTFEDPEEGIPFTAEGVPVSFDGRTGGGCIPNGPFANMTIHMGPGASTTYYEWCVRRDFMPQFFNESAHSTVISRLMLLPDFGQLTRQAEISVHGAGHPGVGGLYGTLTDTYSSRKSHILLLINLRSASDKQSSRRSSILSSSYQPGPTLVVMAVKGSVHATERYLWSYRR